MRWLPNRRLALAIAAVVVGLPLVLFAMRSPATGAGEGALVASVKKGDFRVIVTTTGELRAQKFVEIQGPANAQQAEVWQMKIATMVPEGTVVKEGDVVAELDRAPVATKMAEFSLQLQKAEAQFTSAALDSALNLATAREAIRTAEFTLEERRLAKEQAVYEAPTIRRQAEIEYEKAVRALEEAKVTLDTKQRQAVAKMAEVGADLGRVRNKLSSVQQVMEAFTVRAPASGMVIYAREWNGRKKGVGSQVSPWEPTVATLPDLELMESVTYVNEIDVRRLAVGQPVEVSLDADPSKRLEGKVTAVANVGEQRPNADAKVFEVKITLMQADTTLRPGMTTSNAIETSVIPNALFIPIEAVTNEGVQTFVYKRDGGSVVRQQIETGTMNENEIVVLRGLAANDVVLLAPPADRTSVETIMLPGGPAGDAPQGQPVPVGPGVGAGGDSAASAPTSASVPPPPGP